MYLFAAASALSRVGVRRTAVRFASYRARCEHFATNTACALWLIFALAGRSAAGEPSEFTFRLASDKINAGSTMAGEIEFGTLPVGKPNEICIVLSAGGQPFRVTRTKTSCGCMLLDPIEAAPASEHRIRVRISAASAEQAFEKHLLIEMLSGKNTLSSLSLAIRGDFRYRFSFGRSQVVLPRSRATIEDETLTWTVVGREFDRKTLITSEGADDRKTTHDFPGDITIGSYIADDSRLRQVTFKALLRELPRTRTYRLSVSTNMLDHPDRELCSIPVTYVDDLSVRAIPESILERVLANKEVTIECKLVIPPALTTRIWPEGWRVQIDGNAIPPEDACFQQSSKRIVLVHLLVRDAAPGEYKLVFENNPQEPNVTSAPVRCSAKLQIREDRNSGTSNAPEQKK